MVQKAHSNVNPEAPETVALTDALKAQFPDLAFAVFVTRTSEDAAEIEMYVPQGQKHEVTKGQVASVLTEIAQDLVLGN